MKRSDWLPASREKQLEMAKSWLPIMKVKGKLVWKMEQELIDDFEDAITAAHDEFYRPRKDRTAGTNARLSQAFKRLIALMREIKRRYLIAPLMTEEDYINMHLRSPDTIPTPVPAPAGQATADVGYVGGGQLQLIMKHIESTPIDERADYGYKIFYKLLPLNDPAPSSPNELLANIFTRHKKYTFTFEPENSGKRAYFCIRYENSKSQHGPWGPMFSAIIP